jgi:hypothetical protein
VVTARLTPRAQQYHLLVGGILSPCYVLDVDAHLGAAQKRTLYEDGYVHLPGVVPRPLIDRALRAINHSLGTEGMAKDALAGFEARTYTPELVRSNDITGLYTRSPLPSFVESALGRAKVRSPGEAQIALRFPTLERPVHPAVPHIDGVYSPGNGVPPGTLAHFTALVGVFLSDATEPDRGNFTLWPGSHHLLEAHFRRFGLEGLMGAFPQIALPSPRPLLAKAGDAVLAHYQLAHGVAPNRGPHIRYAVFFRIFHVDHQESSAATLGDIWREWEGLDEVLPGA